MTCKLPDDPPVVVPPMATLYRDVKVWRRTARRCALDSIYSIAVEPANGGVEATIGLTTHWIPGYLKNQHIILKTQGHVHWRPTFSKKCRTKSSCGNEHYAIVYHGLCLNIIRREIDQIQVGLWKVCHLTIQWWMEGAMVAASCMHIPYEQWGVLGR